MIKYVIYRIYNSKEVFEKDNRAVFYGWTTSKSVLKTFLNQRDPKKYKYVKVDTNNLSGTNLYDLIDDMNVMIDFMKLKSVKTNEEYHLFMTLNESKEAEINIQEWFNSLSSIKNSKKASSYLNIYMNLDTYYLNGLEVIGYRPMEVDEIFDSEDNKDNFNPIELVTNEIEDAYEGMNQHPAEDPERYLDPPGLMTISDVISKCIYSLEAFIMVMKDNL